MEELLIEKRKIRLSLTTGVFERKKSSIDKSLINSEEIKNKNSLSEEEKEAIIKEKEELEKISKEDKKFKEKYLKMGLTENSIKILAILNESAENNIVKFNKLIEGKDRKIGSHIFYELLVLTNKKLVNIKQDEQNDDIIVNLNIN